MYQYFTVPHVVWSDSASLVEMTGVQSLSSQSLLKSENDRNSLSSRTPVDFDQNLTEYLSFWQNNLALKSLDGLHWTLKQASQTTCMQTSPNKERFWHILAN